MTEAGSAPSRTPLNRYGIVGARIPVTSNVPRPVWKVHVVRRSLKALLSSPGDVVTIVSPFNTIVFGINTPGEDPVAVFVTNSGVNARAGGIDSDRRKRRGAGRATTAGEGDQIGGCRRRSGQLNRYCRYERGQKP